MATLSNSTFRPRTTILPPEHKFRKVSHPRPSASLNLTRKGRTDGPLGGTTYAPNTIPRYQQPAHEIFPESRPYNPSLSNINSPQYQSHRAQPQPSNSYLNTHARSMDRQNSDQTVHASHPSATYANNNYTQATSRAQGKFLLNSFHNLEDLSLSDAIKPRG